MRMLILGATGFIGGQIARLACETGFDVRGLRRRAGSVGAVGDLPVEWHPGDLSDPDSLVAALRGCETLIHAAAYYPVADRDPIRAASRARAEIGSVLEAARRAGARRVIYTSSLTTIGQPPAGSDRLADERDGYSPGSAGSAYFEAKWVMEQAALQAAREGLPLVVLIPTGVFGPGDVKPVTGAILRDVARGRMPIGIDALTNFVDVRDVALAHIRAVEEGGVGQRYLIGGHNLTIADMLRQAAQAAGVRPPLWNLSRDAAIRLVAIGGTLRLPIPELVRGLAHLQALNCEEGWKTFGFAPRPFAETARDAIQWFRQNGYL